ncbi:glycosyltransferase [Hyphomicrobium facile]|uniref:Glycosyl transferase family 2 n=1 Tax=Hyphomicrobium facile TaxID=51670 RepID=A0A1I7NHX0_9HYPH|nr:glycosyltransferase [Hyphomicrobium facile]SFV34234.1 Glycosyl transferase family 2 [Hyphomicrobium facile]
MAPNVDVVLPVRNGARYLQSAIESLLAEIKMISRIIVIDDGSTDDTPAILSGLALSPKIHVIRQQTSGLIAALNRGLETSDAQFVARMDADDVSLVGRLENQVRFLETNPGVAAVGCQVDYIDEDGHSTGSRTHYPTDPKDIREQLCKSCVVCHPTVLARRDALLSIGRYRNVFQHAEDYDLFLRLSEQFQIANLPEVFFKYRRHGDQVSNSGNIRQSFSRDLALYAAKERRAGRLDPTIGWTEPPRYNDEILRGSADPMLRDLGITYEAIEQISHKRPELVSRDAILKVLDLARRRYLGEGRKQRYGLVRRVGRLAFERNHLLLAGYATWALWQIRIADSRWFRHEGLKILSAVTAYFFCDAFLDVSA